MRIGWRRRREPAWKNVAAGALGGLAGSAAMTGFQALWNLKSQNGRRQKREEPATIKTARALMHSVGQDLPKSKRGIASNAVHYAFGTLSGAAYGAIGHKLPLAKAGRGTLFGVGLWALTDEVLVPALKLSKPVTDYPPSTHMYGLASHLVYAVAADATAKLARRVL